MKVFKELPPSLFHSLRLSLIPISKLLSRRKEQLPVIVSLTSIPGRFKRLHLVIRSLLTQSHHPKKIVLWLNDELRDQIPEKLLKLQGEVFEICYSPLNCSHRKLIHSLEKYPEEIIITCDDDMIYAKNWLYLLYKAHQNFPKDVIGNRTLHINHDASGKPLPYSQWRYPSVEDINQKAQIPIGAWGVLYPPKSLSYNVLDVELFLKIAPKNDDLWFKAMALLNHTISRPAEIRPPEPIPIIGTQKIALKKENKDNAFNDTVWKSLDEYYDLSTYILD